MSFGLVLLKSQLQSFEVLVAAAGLQLLDGLNGLFEDEEASDSLFF